MFSTLCSKYPASFHKWYLLTFPEPTQWFQSRLLFARSTAVWSIVGYIVGLGDRHGENILLDERNGEAIHVDFDCLFGKGKQKQTQIL
jgi:serine/threonine-protein kinase ATR